MSNSKINPPGTDRGVEKKVSLSIDWISVTFKKGTKVVYPECLSERFVQCKPLNSYNVGSKFEDGRIVLSHTMRPEMGTHIICSGDTLRNMPIEPKDLLKFWIEAGAVCKRLDLAVDALNWHLAPQTAKFLISVDAVKTRSREFPHWGDAKAKGFTQYVGKKSSVVCTRIYDKSAEMGIDADWTRVETVFSGDRAHSASVAIIRGSDIRALVRGAVDFPAWGVWLAVMESEAEKLPQVKKISSTKLWLLAQCAPALADQMKLDGDEEFLTKFLDVVRERYHRSEECLNEQYA